MRKGRLSLSPRLKGWLLTACAAAGAMVSPSLVGAADEVTQDAPSATFFQPLQVPLVSVDVTAVGKDGQPVPGLVADDFEVLEDGRPVAISHFYVAPPLLPQQPDGETPPPVTGNSDLYLAVFVDDSNLSPQRRRAALEHLRSFLERPLPPATHAMLVRYTGNLHIASDFSDRSQELLPHLDEIIGKAPVAFATEAEMLLREMQNASTASAVHESAATTSGFGSLASDLNKQMGETFLPQIRSLAGAMYARNQASLETLAEFVRFLSGVPGRKAVLWVGGGLEMRVGENLFRTWEHLFPEQARDASFNAAIAAREYDSSGDLRKLVRFANAHRVSFYTLSSLAAGLTRQSSAEVSTMGAAAGPGFLNLMSEEEALTFMSGFTGGRSLADNPGLEGQLHQLARELGSYYSLGYTPPSAGDGKYHSITVKVRRDGVALRYRQGYQDSGEEDGLTDRTLAAAMLGVADNPLGIVLESQPQEARADGRFLVPVQVRIPIGELVLLPSGDVHSGQISLYTVIRDGADRLSKVHSRTYPVEFANAQLLEAVERQSGFVIGMGMLMREGPQRIAVTIRDDRSLVESTAFLDVDVGADHQDTSG